MAVLRRPFERARRLAHQVLWECGVDDPSKIDPFVVVGRRGIELIYAKMDGASARIFRNGDRAIIRVSDQIVQLGRLRFTIAHELGHFLLGHQIPSEAILDAGAAAPFSVHQEREADVFASEFLMPAEWVAPFCVGTPASLDADRKPVAGTTAWLITTRESKQFAPSTAPFMVNYRVADLHALVAALKAEGCNVLEKIDESEYGKFAWVIDPEGNKVELWQPPDGQ